MIWQPFNRAHQDKHFQRNICEPDIAQPVRKFTWWTTKYCISHKKNPQMKYFFSSNSVFPPILQTILIIIKPWQINFFQSELNKMFGLIIDKIN